MVIQILIKNSRLKELIWHINWRYEEIEWTKSIIDVWYALKLSEISWWIDETQNDQHGIRISCGFPRNSCQVQSSQEWKWGKRTHLKITQK